MPLNILIYIRISAKLGQKHILCLHLSTTCIVDTYGRKPVGIYYKNIFYGFLKHRFRKEEIHFEPFWKGYAKVSTEWWEEC